jgi:hypothetical protein
MERKPEKKECYRICKETPKRSGIPANTSYETPKYIACIVMGDVKEGNESYCKV